MIDDTLNEKTSRLGLSTLKSLLSTRSSNDMCKQFYMGNYFRTSTQLADSVHLHSSPQRSLINNVW